MTSENTAHYLVLHFMGRGPSMLRAESFGCCAPFSDCVLPLLVAALPDDHLSPVYFSKGVETWRTKAPGFSTI